MFFPRHGAAGLDCEPAGSLGSGKLVQDHAYFRSATALCGLIAAGLVALPGAARAQSVDDTYTMPHAGIGYGVSGSDTIDITTASSATMTGANVGIETSAEDGATTINVGGAVSSSETGIRANASGLGDIAINTAAGVTVSGDSSYGITAASQGGAIDIGGAAGLGGAVSGNVGIFASTTGAGTIDIKTASGGTVTGTNAEGIHTTAEAGSTIIDIGANVSGQAYGIQAEATGAGDITVRTATGVAVTSAVAYGIMAVSQGGAVNIGGAVGLGGAVSGETGILAINHGAGAIDIKTTANVTGTGSVGIFTQTEDGATTISIGSGATITAPGAAIFATTGNGDVTVANAGTVKGLIQGYPNGTGTFTFNNSGL